MILVIVVIIFSDVGSDSVSGSDVGSDSDTGIITRNDDNTNDTIYYYKDHENGSILV